MREKTGLGNLHPELLSMVIDLAAQDALRPFPALNLVNHHFNNVANNLVRRKFELDFTPGEKLLSTWKLMDRMLEDRLMLRNIRSLHVSAVPASHLQVLNDVEAELDEEDQHHSVEDSQTTNTRWRNLPKLISRLSNLKELIWSADCPLTRSVIEALQENHKSAILKIFNWSRDDINRGHDDDDELALIDCPNLYSVTANMEVSMNTEYSDMREAAFFRLLASAPNLRHASLVKTLTYSIGSRAPLQFQYNEERRKELFRVDKTSTSLRSLALDGLGAGKQVLDIASRYVDLSKLESFKFTRGRPDKEFFEEAPKRLPNLKEFSLNFMTMDKDRDLVSAANIFIANCDLQMLSLWSWHGIVPFDTILKPSLKTLELHERDMWGRERHLLSLQDLQKIRSTCPDLTNLTFDLQIGGFDGDNPKMYEELSKFPSLKKVEIYFDLGLEGWAVEEALRRMRGEPPLTSKQKANPYRNKKSQMTKTETLQHLHTMWSMIYGHKASFDSKLEVKIGEWERKLPFNGPPGWLVREQQIRRYYQVRKAERDDMQSDISVKAFRGSLEKSAGGKGSILATHYPSEPVVDDDNDDFGEPHDDEYYDSDDRTDEDDETYPDPDEDEEMHDVADVDEVEDGGDEEDPDDDGDLMEDDNDDDDE